jgi:hypothetical protein
MKKLFSGLLLGLVITLVIAMPVLASYYANLTVTEANGNDYDQLGMQVSLDVDYLADNGYITATGLDTRVTSGGTTLPHMMVDDRVLFTSDLEAYGTLNLLFETGQTALSSFPVVVGDGGYVTITDAANLELADDFELEFEGYIDTSVDADIVLKQAAARIYKDSGDIIGAIYGVPATLTLVPNGAGDYTNIDSVTGAATHWEAVDDAPGADDGATTQVHTVSAVQQKDAYNLAYSATLDDNWINSVKVYFICYGSDATETAQPFLRLGTDETTGTEVNLTNAWTEYSEVLARPGGGTWKPSDIEDLQACIGLKQSGGDIARCTQIYIEVSYSPSVMVTVPAVASGKYIVALWADGANLGIDIDGSTEDTTALGGASSEDNANNWIIANIPYYNYYTHTTSSTLRLTYEPTSIIKGEAYSVGTVTVTNGDATILGAGGATWTECMEGSIFVSADGVWYVVDTVTDATHLELTTVYGGGTLGGQSYNMYPRLPNEESALYDGAITFGSNPAGVTLSLGGFISEEQLLPGGGAAEFPETQEIAGETGQPGYTSDLATLPTHPFYPLISAINVQTGIPIGIVWILGASFILAVLFVWMIGSHGMMHQMFIGLAGGGWVAFCWHQGIYPFWVIFIYAVLVIAIVVGERSPTIS